MIKEAVGLLKIPRTQSAPSVVGLVEEDHKKKKKYPKQERSSSCGDLISMSREIPKDCSESVKGARKLLKKIKGRTGVFSPEENVVQEVLHVLVLKLGFIRYKKMRILKNVNNRGLCVSNQRFP